MATSKKSIFRSPFNAIGIEIPVYQGEEVMVKDIILLGMFTFSGLVLGTNARSSFKVCFNLDINGILLVTAEQIASGRQNQ
ncbi:heat shock cognate 70 kDa protein-like protein [Tanacetum coccineum]